MEDGTRRWYGGTTSDEISNMESDRIGVGHWAQEGIAARGVLIDYVSYAEKNGMCAFYWHHANGSIPMRQSKPACM